MRIAVILKAWWGYKWYHEHDWPSDLFFCVFLESYLRLRH